MHEKQALLNPIAHVPVCHPAIFADDSNGTFNYEATGRGPAWHAAYSDGASLACTKGTYLRTNTDVPTAGDWTQIEKKLWATPTARATLQMTMMAPSIGKSYELYIAMIFYDGTHARTAELRIDSWTRSVLLRAELMMWHELTALSFNPTFRMWNNLLVSCDFNAETAQYIRLNNAIISGAPFLLYRPLDARAAYLSFSVRIRTAVSDFADIALDQILITPDIL